MQTLEDQIETFYMRLNEVTVEPSITADESAACNGGINTTTGKSSWVHSFLNLPIKPGLLPTRSHARGNYRIERLLLRLDYDGRLSGAGMLEKHTERILGDH